MSGPAPAPRIYSLGHSTRTLADLLDILESHGVATLADVRKIPGSRRFPHFNREVLRESLPQANIEYVPLPKLAGRRRASPEAASPNAGWRHASFRAYADYMATDDFELGLQQLLTLAERGPVAMMCAEAVPWRCHRMLIADALAARGVEVLHLDSRRPGRPHRVTPFARFDGRRVTYPAYEPPARPVQGELFEPPPHH